MSKPKALVVLTPGFAADEHDEACLPFLQLLVQAINRNNPEVKLIVLAFQYPFRKDEYEWYSNKVIAFGGESRPKLNRLKIWLQVWKRLNKLRCEYDIQGLFSLWCTECALVGRYYAQLHRLPHYIWLCGQDAKKTNKYVAWARPPAESVIVMSDFLKREFNANHHIQPVHMIPLGINPALYPPPAAQRDIDLLATGSLIPLKQYHIFTEIVREIKKQLPGVKAVLRGSGPEEDRIRALIKEHKLEDTLQIIPEIPYAEVLGLMQHSRVFLHTSSYEGLGTVILEALYAGAHVISFVKPMDRKIPHWHVVSSKEEMIATALALLQNRALDHSPVCPYEIDKTARQIMALYYL